MMRSSTRVPVRTKIGYGVAEAGVIAVEIQLWLYLIKFYNEVVGLSPELVSLALALPIVWDIASDFLMGSLSDHTRAKQGRRRVYFIPGSVAVALALILLFRPPEMDATWIKVLYLTLTYTFVSTAMTVIGVPHTTLGGEMSFDRDERTEFFGSRLVFATLGLLIGVALPNALAEESALPHPDNRAYAHATAAYIFVVPIILSAVISYLATSGYDRPSSSTPRRMGIARRTWSVMRDTFSVVARNPYFPILLIAFLIAGLGRTLNASIALYYYETRLKLAEGDTNIVLMVFFAVLMLSVVLWVLLSRWLGKKWPAFAGVVGLGLMTMIAYPLFPEGSIVGPLIAGLFGGIFGGAIILFDSIVADVVDYDRLKTRKDHEGLYFGAWRAAMKLARLLGILATGLLLPLTGFDASLSEQPAGTGLNLALLFGPGVGAFFIVAGVIFAFFPLTDERHRRIQAILERREKRRASTG